MTKLNSYLAEVKERADKATSGPWKACRINGGCYVERVESDSVVEMIAERVIKDKERWPEGYDTSLFIAHSRQDIPTLLRLLEMVIERIEPNEAERIYSEVINVEG